MYIVNEFGFNSNILETNLFNIVILIGLITYVASGFFKTTIDSRRVQIIKTLDTLDENLISANERFIESNKQLKQITLLINNLQQENVEQKLRVLDKRYSELVKEVNRLFDLSILTIENTAQETFSFLQRYLITLVIGKLLLKFSSCKSAESKSPLSDQQNLLSLCIDEMLLT